MQRGQRWVAPFGRAIRGNLLFAGAKLVRIGSRAHQGARTTASMVSSTCSLERGCEPTGNSVFKSGSKPSSRGSSREPRVVWANANKIAASRNSLRWKPRFDVLMLRAAKSSKKLFFFCASNSWTSGQQKTPSKLPTGNTFSCFCSRCKCVLYSHVRDCVGLDLMGLASAFSEYVTSSSIGRLALCRIKSRVKRGCVFSQPFFE